MTIYELMDIINDSTVIELYSAETCDLIGTYDGKEEMPEDYLYCNITDIFVNENNLCIEIDY